MAQNETRRLSPGVLQVDKDGLAALKKIDDYTPANKDYAVAKVQAAADAMDAALEAEAQADTAAAAARDAATAAEWGFHNAMLGVKKQVAAQYGDDSDEIQSVGLTKKSERARRGPRGKTPPAKG